MIHEINTTEKSLRDGFAPSIDEVSKATYSVIHEMLSELLEKHSNETWRENMGNLYNAWGRDGDIFRTYNKFFKTEISPWRRDEDGTTHREFEKHIGIEEDKLKTYCEERAEELVDAYVYKLMGKINGVTDVEVKAFSTRGSYHIKGKFNDHDVRVEQIVVHKFSSRHTFFLQFPARIYVDGKFTSAKDFKAFTNN